MLQIISESIGLAIDTGLLPRIVGWGVGLLLMFLVVLAQHIYRKLPPAKDPPPEWNPEQGTGNLSPKIPLDQTPPDSQI